MDDPQLYALSCPLEASTALARLRTLGPSVERPTGYHGAQAMEVSVGDTPLAPVLDVLVETRPVGCYVTLRVLRSTFLTDLMRLSRGVFALCAMLGAGYAVAGQQGLPLARALAAIAVGYLALAAATAAIERALELEMKAHLARLRLNVGNLVAR